MAFLTGKSVGTSKRVFYALIALTLVVFGAFFLVGYHRPYEENPAFSAPALTDALLVFMLLLVFVAVVVTLWSVAKHVRSRSDVGTENLVPVRKTAFLVIAGTVVLLLGAFLLAPSSAIRINVENYENAFWLKVAGMFVAASIVMILVALCAIFYDYVKHRR